MNKVLHDSGIRKVLCLGILLTSIFPSHSLTAQNITVNISGIRAEKGQIVIGVFKDSDTYQKEEPFVNEIFSKTKIQGEAISVQFSLEPGIYGLCLLDDENNNGKMEYNFVGMPKEGFGFSDYYHKGITKPKFDSFKFTLNKDQNKNITIKVRYIL
jgi:uncharacterized protein (DUF2141 family)